jgi:hypothetical protein
LAPIFFGAKINLLEDFGGNYFVANIFGVNIFGVNYFGAIILARIILAGKWVTLIRN